MPWVSLVSSRKAARNSPSHCSGLWAAVVKWKQSSWHPQRELIAGCGGSGPPCWRSPARLSAPSPGALRASSLSRAYPFQRPCGSFLPPTPPLLSVLGTKWVIVEADAQAAWDAHWGGQEDREGTLQGPEPMPHIPHAEGGHIPAWPLSPFFIRLRIF